MHQGKLNLIYTWDCDESYRSCEDNEQWSIQTCRGLKLITSRDGLFLFWKCETCKNSTSWRIKIPHVTNHNFADIFHKIKKKLGYLLICNGR